MALRYEDLPEKLRAQIPDADGPAPRRRGKGGGTVRSGNTWRCHGCGATFTVWAKAERHGNDDGHHRIEIVFPAEAT